MSVVYQNRSRKAINDSVKEREINYRKSILTNIVIPQTLEILTTLKRFKYSSEAYNPETNTFDPIWLQEYANDPTIPSIASLAAVHAMDAYIHDLNFNQISTAILQDSSLSIHIQNLSYFTPLAAVVSPVKHIIGKCLKGRCQNRTMDNLLRKYLISRTIFRINKRKDEEVIYDGSVFQLCKDLVLCGLLGNYEFCDPISRPTSNVRKRLYEIFHNDDMNHKYNRWILALFHHCWQIPINCIRLYIIYSIKNHPSLAFILSDFLHLTEWQKMIENQFMVPIRQYFELNLLLPTSDLFQSFEHLPLKGCDMCHLYSCGHARICHTHPCVHHRYNRKRQTTSSSVHDEERKRIDQALHNEAETGWSWTIRLCHKELNKLAGRVEVDMCTISYRRPHTDALDSLRPLLSQSISADKRYAPLIPYPGAVKQESPYSFEYNNSGDDDDDDEKVKKRQKQKKKKKKKFNPSFNIDFNSYISTCYLPFHQMHSLVQVCQSIGPIESGAIDRMIEAFPYFGIHPIRVPYLQKLLALHGHGGDATLELINSIFVTIHRLEPQLYNLLQISLNLIQQCQRRMRLYLLPYSILYAQLNAIQKIATRFAHESDPTHGMKAATNNGTVIPLLENYCAFVFCPVCLHVYSMVNDNASIYKNTYKYGKRDVAKDFLTGEIYCNRKIPKINYRGICGKLPLTRIPMIGRILLFHLKMIAICPQNDCGMLFAFNAKERDSVVYNERGFSCHLCSAKLTETPLSYEKVEQRYNTSKSIECNVCSQPILKPKHQGYIYPYDIHLCHIHTPEKRDELNRRIHANPFQPNDENNRSILLEWMHEIFESEAELIEQKRRQREEDAYERIKARKTLQQLQLINKGLTHISQHKFNKKRLVNDYSKD